MAGGRRGADEALQMGGGLQVLGTRLRGEDDHQHQWPIPWPNHPSSSGRCGGCGAHQPHAHRDRPPTLAWNPPGNTARSCLMTLLIS